MKKIKYPHAATVNVAPGKSNIHLYKHQEDAIKNLNDKILGNGKVPFAGLIVLPTGGGKTLTATYWLLKNYTDKGKKILWIAHRHELLEQAKHSFEQLAYSDIVKNRSSFNYRVISGLHDRPVNIKPTDDIIISSKDSINGGYQYLYEKWIKHHSQELFLVIDEAHHATAKTYRRLIENVQRDVDDFLMVGLTATPFRTAEEEKGLLLKVFPDDIIYKIDLRTLINRGILSKPIFEEVKTRMDMTKVLNEKELDNISFFDITSIGKATAKTIAENTDRNHCIVDQYIRNKNKYQKTLVFALNIDNAIALNKLFNEKGVKSEYVVSSIKDAVTGVTISGKENKEKIERFRNGDLDTLINVNILTEGTDLPETRTIFLARPTISSILMTQMIGRGLRGVKAGGTDEAYIVGFIDDWKDKVAWVNPQKLVIEESTFPEGSADTQKKLVRLISIEKIEEFASVMDETVNTDELESIEFIERVPVGLYSFPILKPLNDDELEKNCEILVYDNINLAYEGFVNSLQDFFEQNELENKDILTEEELEILSGKIEDEFFYGCEKYPGYLVEDIKDILFFFAQKGIKPDFIRLEEREKYDLTKLGNRIYEEDMGEKEKKKFIDDNWSKDESRWKVFFGFEKKHFLNEIDLILRKRSYPELYEKGLDEPEVVPEERNLELLSMSELKECCPKYWRKLSDRVYERYRDKNGYYYSAKSREKGKSKLKFEIDHIRPLSKGGLTRLDNLQLLTRQENREKGDRENVKENADDKEVMTLVNLFKSTHDDIKRRKIAHKLEKIQDTRVVPILNTALDDNDPSTARSAARGLRLNKDTRSISPLIKKFRSKDINLRIECKDAIVNIGKEAIPSLLHALTRKNSNIRDMAVDALGEIGEKSTLKYLIDALNDKSSSVRWRAAKALGNFDDEKTIQPLKEASNDPAKTVQKYAELSLENKRNKIKKLYEKFDNELAQYDAMIYKNKIGSGDSYYSPKKHFLSTLIYNKYRMTIWAFIGNQKGDGIKRLKEPGWATINIYNEEEFSNALKIIINGHKLFKLKTGEK